MGACDVGLVKDDDEVQPACRELLGMAISSSRKLLLQHLAMCLGDVVAVDDHCCYACSESSSLVGCR